MPADLVLLGAHVRTLDPAVAGHALALANGRILALGDELDVREHVERGRR